MRDPARIDPILREVRRIWLDYPDLRLGQLIANVIPRSRPCPEVFYFEDDELLRLLRAYPADPSVAVDDKAD